MIAYNYDGVPAAAGSSVKSEQWLRCSRTSSSDMPIEDKIKTVAREIDGAGAVEFESAADRIDVTERGMITGLF